MYNVEGRTFDSTGSRGRGVGMNATITREIVDDRPARSKNSQGSTVRGDGYTDFDQGGHLQSHANGGAGERINIVPLEGALDLGQRDRWRKMARFIEVEARKGRTVDMRMTLDYDANSAKPYRPTRIEVEIAIDGVLTDFPFGFANLAP